MISPRQILFCAVALAAAASCSPQSYVLDLEMRYPSASGDDFAGKEMAVVYLDNEDHTDSLKCFPMAEALATAMEKDYFDSSRVIPIYSIQRAPGADYSCRDTLVSLVMETGKDVVFLMDSDKIHYYDAMGRDAAKSIAWSRSKNLLSEWRLESYTIVYYEESAWEKALDSAARMEWAKASDQWIAIAEKCTNNMQKRSCAEYDIALACYMLGNYDLALEWLAASDADYPVSLSPGLRRRIANRKANQ